MADGGGKGVTTALAEPYLLILLLQTTDLAEVNSYFRQCMRDASKMAEKVDDHLEPIPPQIMGSVTRTDPETLRQYEEIGE